VLENVGHFPHREAPEPVAEAVLHHFRQSANPDSHES
jgi:pimeloyl-ACP methyl ester carboxylesterase